MQACTKRLIDRLCTRLKFLSLAVVIVSVAGCSGIESPTNDQCVEVGSELEIRWTPKKKPMVIQYYQNEKCLRSCRQDAPHEWSGTKIHINTTEKTEIKIWRPDGAKPFDSVWIYVEEKCPDPQ